MVLNSNELNSIIDSTIRLSKAIFRTPYGILIIVLCVIVYFQYQQSKRCEDEKTAMQIDFINTLKGINEGLNKLGDTTIIPIK